MARKGDIDSKTVSARVSMEVYIRLLKESSSNNKSLGSYLKDILSDEKTLSTGEKIIYKDKIIYEDKIIYVNNTDENILHKIKDYEEMIQFQQEKIKALNEINDSFKEYKRNYSKEKFDELTKELSEKNKAIEDKQLFLSATSERNNKLFDEVNELKDIIRSLEHQNSMMRGFPRQNK